MAHRSPYVVLFKSEEYQKVLLFHLQAIEFLHLMSKITYLPQRGSRPADWSVYIQPHGRQDLRALSGVGVSDDGLHSPSSHVIRGSSQALNSSRKAVFNQIS